MRRRLSDIATDIRVHLERFESDPSINKRDPHKLSRFYNVNAYVGGRFVYVRYVSFQGQSHLTRAEAEKYLAWLDAGNVGKHQEAQRATEAPR